MEMSRKEVFNKGTEDYICRIEGFAELLMSKESFEMTEKEEMKNTLYELTELLSDLKQGKYHQPPTKFLITDEQLKKVKLPEQAIGVNTFSKCINEVIDLHISKKLTGIELNQKLKKRGVLSEKILDEKRKRTVTNDRSSEYGFVSEQRERDGSSYEMVLINEKGKLFLLSELNQIMNG